ncbi:MAG: SET domain-containing protein-lysine N-methyltransferase [Candidatus Chisholmbacteria bacterium]|nr:SET domain-containing protein-lysine N-methyltransferase [Candidatus Chisholmbacteria bacterium]
MTKNILVEQSKIQGKGVFTVKDFKRGDIILDIDDTRVVKDFSQLSKQDQDHCDYLGDKTVLMQSPEKYINHSCDPNTYVKTIKGIRRVIALRNIRKGEEITYDYAINGYYESQDPCHCGAKNCRRVINCDFFQLPKQLQLKYLPYLDDWFTQKFTDKIQKLTHEHLLN